MAEKREMAPAIKLCKNRVLNDVEIVKLYTIDIKVIEQRRSLQHIVASFPGETQYEVRTNAEVATFGAFNRVDEFLHTVAAIDPSKRPFMDRFQSEFEPNVRVMRDIGDEVEDVVGNTVRARRNGKADHLGKFQRFTIEFLQFRHRIVRVRVALEIGDKLLRLVPPADGRCALSELLGYGSARAIILGCVTGVVAVRAAAHRNSAVSIRAGKVHPQSDFINPCGKSIFQHAVVRVEALTVPTIL